MKKITRFASLTACWFTIMLNAQTYYISNSGDDSDDGLSTATAWATIDKLNTISLGPGDQILFERGGTYVGTIALNNSGESGNPIVFDAYGTGDKPIISGAETLTLTAGSMANVYEANTTNTIEGVYLNGTDKYLFARMPNTGFYTIESNTSTSITDNTNLNNTTDYYNGTHARMRTQAWAFEAREITSSGGGTLDFVGDLEYTDIDGWGYFLDNHIDFLDDDNEFYYDASSQKLLLYSTSNLNGSSVVASHLNYGIDVAVNRSYIEINNLHFMYQAINAIDFLVLLMS